MKEEKKEEDVFGSHPEAALDLSISVFCLAEGCGKGQGARGEHLEVDDG